MYFVYVCFKVLMIFGTLKEFTLNSIIIKKKCGRKYVELTKSYGKL